MYARDLLEPHEVRKLMDACPEGPTGDRDRALIAIMSCTGIRVAEALALCIGDLDLATRRVHVRRGKGGRPRHVWIHPDARRPVQAWLRTRKRLGIEGGTILCSLRGEQLSQSYVRRILPQIARRSGIEKRVYADGFRHTFAARAYRAKVTVRSLQVQFGHHNITATVDYLERMGLHSGFEELERALT